MAVAAHAAPRYRQVAAELERAIESGGLRPHDRLASERAIAERHGLSRMTARQAVESLVRRGTVNCLTGSGTFVSPPRVVHTLQRLAGFSERMRAQGIEPSGHVLEMRRTRRVDVQARAALELGPGGRAWMVRRVRFGDREPLLLETFWVPDALCPDLARRELAQGSLYDLMRRRYGIDPCTADESIEPAWCSSPPTPATWAPAPARRRWSSPARRATARAGRWSSPATSTAATALASRSHSTRNPLGSDPASDAVTRA